MFIHLLYLMDKISVLTHMHVMFCIGKIVFIGLCTLVFIEATQTVIGRAFTSNKYVADSVMYTQCDIP